MPDDAYNRFLGMPDGPRPPKAHVLLGVEPDVNDPEIIEAAVQRRMDQLDQYALSNNRATREQVQRLMNEVAKARVTLVKRAEQRAKKATQLADATPIPAPAATPTVPPRQPQPTIKPLPTLAAVIEKPAKPSRPPFKLSFTWPKLSAEAWSLLGVAWLMSIVVTATAAYFVASSIEPVPPPPPAGPIADNTKPKEPQDEPTGNDSAPPTLDPVDVEDAPVDPQPEPEPEPQPEPGPTVVAGFDPASADLQALTSQEIMDHVMAIEDTDERFQSYLVVRDRLAEQPVAQLKLVIQALKAFSNMDFFEHAASVQRVALGPTKINADGRSRLELTDLSAIQGMTFITLELRQQDGIKDFSPLGTISAQTLVVDSCDHFTDIGILKGVKNLQSLDLTGSAISDLSALAGLPITDLVLDRCEKLTSLDGLDRLPNLKSVSLKETRVLPSEVARAVGAAPGVKINESYHPSVMPLNVRDWEALSKYRDETTRHHAFIKLRDSLPPFSQAQIDLIRKELRHLNGTEVELRMWKHQASEYKITVGISGRNKGIKNLSPLAGVTAQAVWLRYLPDVEDFNFLRGSTIEHLDLSGCDQFTDVALLNTIEGLDKINLSGTGISDLRPLEIESLSELSIEHCKNIRSLSGLRLKTINRLSAAGSTALHDIDELHRVQGLTYLNLSGTSIDHLLPVARHTGLLHLDLSNCKDIRSVELLSKLTKLNKLVLHGLTEVPQAEFARLKQDLPNTTDIQYTPSNAVAGNDEPEAPPRPEPEPDLLPPLSYDKIRQIQNPRTRAYEFVKLRDSLEPYSRQQASLIRDAMRDFNEERRLNVEIKTNGKDAFTLVNREPEKSSFDSPLSKVKDISMLQGLTFEKVDLSGMISLSDFTALGTMKIKELNLNYCLMLRGFEAINKIEGLESLDLSNTNFDDLGELTIQELDTLTMKTCRRLTSLDGLEGKTIRFLSVGENLRITDYDALAQVKGLKWLDLNSTAITSSRPLDGLELERLDVSDCRDLVELNHLMDMNSLEKLDVSGTRQFTDSYLRALKSRIKGLEITHTTHPSGR